MVDLKITELAALTVVNDEDLIAIVDDPTGTASTKKIRTDDFQSTWHVGARVYNNADLTIATAEWTNLTFNSEDFDTDTIHDTSTNTDRLMCKSAGVYLAVFNARFDTNATGERQAQIRLDDTTPLSYMIAFSEATTNATFLLTVVLELSVNQFLTVRVNQSSGGNLNIDSTSGVSPYFSMHRIG